VRNHFLIHQEGGIEESAYGVEEKMLFCFAWMAIMEPSTGQVGWSKTGSFPLPKPVTDLVRGGMELGHADDQVFGRQDSKKKDGVVGILTHGIINRTLYYEHALILGLIPFINRSIY